jgi:tricarballylate dehydrogenase
VAEADRRRFDFLPTQLLTKSQPRLLPIGGSLAIVEGLTARAEQRGVSFFYETTATRLDVDENDAVLWGCLHAARVWCVVSPAM